MHIKSEQPSDKTWKEKGDNVDLKDKINSIKRNSACKYSGQTITMTNGVCIYTHTHISLHMEYDSGLLLWSSKIDQRGRLAPFSP